MSERPNALVQLPLPLAIAAHELRIKVLVTNGSNVGLVAGKIALVAGEDASKFLRQAKNLGYYAWVYDGGSRCQCGVCASIVQDAGPIVGHVRLERPLV